MKTILFLLSLTILSISAHATIWTVDSLNNAGYGSLRAAVDSSSNGDTVRFNPILISNGSDSIVLSTSVTFSKALTFKGLYSITDTLFISGGGNDRIFTVDSTSHLVIDSLVLINGYSSSNGGAISFVESDSLIINNSIIRNNSSNTHGGGIYYYSLSLVDSWISMVNSRFNGNSCAYYGGAIYGAVNTINAEINVDVNNSRFANNSSDHGALYFLATSFSSLTTVNVQNSKINGNSSTSYGTGLYCNSNDSTLVTIINSEINNNNCVSGGAIYIGSDKYTLCELNNSEVNSNYTNNPNTTGGLLIQSGRKVKVFITNTNIDNNIGDAIKCKAYENETEIINSSISGNAGQGIECLSLNTTSYISLQSSFIHIIDSKINGNTENGISSYGSATGTSIYSEVTAIINAEHSIFDNNGNRGVHASAGAQGSGFGKTIINLLDCSVNNNLLAISSEADSAWIDINETTISENGDTNIAWSGGVYCDAVVSFTNIDKSTITGNRGSTCGGLLFFGNSTQECDITNSTIFNNTSANPYLGGFGGINYASAFFTLNLGSSILALNLPNNFRTTGLNSNGFNIFSDSALVASVSSDQVAIDSMSLNLDSLAANGGSTKTRMPLFPSVAINSGNPLDSTDAQNVPIVGIREVGAAEICFTTFSIDSLITCDSLTWSNGQTYYANNSVAKDTLVNSAGCDSIITLHLIVNYSTIYIDSIISCNSITWIDGNIYSTSNNTARDTLVNSIGCDSIVYLNLEINSNTGIDTIIICDSLTWINSVTYYSSNNTAKDTLVNAMGCDSIVTLNLTILNATFSTDTLTACDSIIWVDGITYYASNNSAIYTLINGVGCDSIVTLNLTILYSTYAIDTLTGCDSLTWINGVTYTTSNNTVTDTLVNSAGCDSIVTLNLTILSSTTFIDNYIVCDSLTWIDGITYYSNNNVATHTLVNVLGCDSIVTLNLYVSNLSSNYSWVDNGFGGYSFTNLSTGSFTNSHWAYGDGITYSNTNSSHTYAANGTYVVVLAIHDSNIVGDSCISYFMDTVVVTSAGNPTCNAGWVVFTDSSSGGLTIVNSSTGTSLSYHWDFGDGDTSNLQFPSHTYASNGPFNLCLTVNDGNGCSDIYCDSISSNGVLFKNGFDLNVVANYPLGIQNFGKESKVKIYPNPTSSILNIETQNFKITKIQILDYSGKVVKTITSNFDVVNVENLATGVYYLELFGESETVTKKFIKQ